jgi:hypothetical protein
LIQQNLYDINNLIETEILGQITKRLSVLLDDLLDSLGLSDLSVRAGEHSTVGEEDPPSLSRGVSHCRAVPIFCV